MQIYVVMESIPYEGSDAVIAFKDAEAAEKFIEDHEVGMRGAYYELQSIELED